MLSQLILKLSRKTQATSRTQANVSLKTDSKLLLQNHIYLNLRNNSYSYQSSMSNFYGGPGKQETNNMMGDKNRLDGGGERAGANPNPNGELPIFPTIAASSHPLISMIHIFLKIGVVAVYIIFPFFSSSFVVKEVVIILAAIDFWIVKNITGRLLVGLRWWVDFQQNGDQRWKFQCKVNENNINKADDKVFWWTLALFTLVWVLLSIANVLTFSVTNLIICIFCLAMIVFNLYSYYRCSKAQSENIKKLAVQYGAGMAMKFMTGSIIANYF